MANISLGNQSTIESIPIQLINASFADGGNECFKTLNGLGDNGYKLATSPEDFGVNGILGVAPFINDEVSEYFSCNTSSCSTQSIESNKKLANPIAFLAESYANGVTFKFPTLGSNGATGAIGYAVFGVDTNSDNTFESSINIYPINIGTTCELFICMYTTLLNTFIQYGFLDTGSNFFYFDDSNINNNNGYYNPNPTLTLYPINTAESNNKVATNINIANLDSLIYSTNNTAFSNIGATIGFDGFLDYGLPFFFGKTVYICFNGKSCNGINGPYWAF